MIPSSFVFLEALPLSTNGKVDRGALPIPGSTSRIERVGTAALRDSLELQLTRIWEDVLGRTSIDRSETFFDLGGHSLMALRLVAKVRERFGRSISMATVFAAPTIARMAALLRADGGSRNAASLVEIQRGRDGQRPFFCVHPSGGNVLCYVDLARRLGEEQTFYGLQSRGIDGADTPLDSVEAMARRYVGEILEARPTGPYLLGGWSMGGIIAYEMARQLTDEHRREVKLVALLDSWIPTTALATRDDAALLLHFLNEIGGVAAHGLDLTADLLRERADQKLELVLDRARTSRILAPEIGLVELEHLLRVFRANIHALHSYRPKPYHGHVAIFRARERIQATSDAPPEADLGWKALIAESVTTHETGGNHYTMLGPDHVDELGLRLGESLRDAVLS
jgi:thioesterase domain-containing protein/acyl carrier protein